MADEQKKIVLSIVVPMFNEEEGIEVFLERVEPIAEAAVAPLCQDYEIVCVDDGSNDGTLEKLRAHAKRNPAIRVVSLSRNFGKDLALTAGLDHARGAAVVPIDADLQDPPELIPELFARWLEGNEVVYATRASRKTDSLGKRLSAGWYYRLHNSHHYDTLFEFLSCRVQLKWPINKFPAIKDARRKPRHRQN